MHVREFLHRHVVLERLRHLLAAGGLGEGRDQQEALDACLPRRRDRQFQPAAVDGVDHLHATLAASAGREHHDVAAGHASRQRSEEHTSELQSLMRITYAAFCLKNKRTLKPYKSKTTTRRHISNNLSVYKSQQI